MTVDVIKKPAGISAGLLCYENISLILSKKPFSLLSGCGLKLGDWFIFSKADFSSAETC